MSITTYTFPNVLTFQERPLFTDSSPKSKAQTGAFRDRSTAQHTLQSEHTEVFSLSLSLSIMLSLSGLNRFVGKSGVQMAEEGDIRLPSPKKQIHRAA